jgi:hypothetical protein
MVGHDWDDQAIWRRSMSLLAEQVMPRLNQHLESQPSAEISAAE